MKTDTQNGFTLVEILVAAVIILLIVISVSGILQKSIRMREKGSEMTGKARIGSALIDIIRRDLNAMVFYPMKKSIYFSLTPDQDSGTNRRDTLSFDALVPYITESGVMIYRFGRVTYITEEQFGMPEYKKLIRRTVFINDEYTDESIEKIIEKEIDKNKEGASISTVRGAMSTDEEKSSKDAESEKEEKEILEAIALERGLQETVLSRRITFFSVDVLDKDNDKWSDISIENKVPVALKITVGMGQKDEHPEEIDSENNEIKFSSILRPVIARYVSNTYPEAASKIKPSVRDIRRDAADRMGSSIR